MKKTSQEWADFNISEYDRCLSIWHSSVGSRRGLNYNALLGAYKHLYGAEINFLDSGDLRNAEAAAKQRDKFASILERIMGSCPSDTSLAIYRSVMDE